jgi:hypothetical protein
MNQLISSPDGQGYFGYHPGYQAYMEVIDFNKLVNDAVKRNRILFERLDLK